MSHVPEFESEPKGVPPVRKTIPFLLTVLITTAGTAGIVRASSSPEPLRVGAPVAPSRVLGVDLLLAKCNSEPKTAPEWTKFAGCVTNNFSKIQKWAHKLDTCFELQPVQSRSDTIFGDDPSDLTHSGWTKGDSLSWGAGGGARFLLEWNTDLAGCPTG
jgi:hypothetical protein